MQRSRGRDGSWSMGGPRMLLERGVASRSFHRTYQSIHLRGRNRGTYAGNRCRGQCTR